MREPAAPKAPKEADEKKKEGKLEAVASQSFHH